MTAGNMDSVKNNNLAFCLELFKAKTLELINRTPKNDATINMESKGCYKYLSQNLIQILINRAIRSSIEYVMSILSEDDQRNTLLSAYNESSTESNIVGGHHAYSSTTSIVFTAFCKQTKQFLHSRFSGNPVTIFIPEPVIQKGQKEIGAFVKTIGSLLTYSSRYGMRSALVTAGCDSEDLEYIQDQKMDKIEDLRRESPKRSFENSFQKKPVAIKQENNLRNLV